MAKQAFHDKFTFTLTSGFIGLINSATSNSGTNTITVPANKRLVARIFIPTTTTYHLNNNIVTITGQSTASDTGERLPGFSYNISDIITLTPDIYTSTYDGGQSRCDLTTPVLIFKPGTQIKFKLVSTADSNTVMYANNVGGISITDFAFINGFLEDDV